MDQENHSHQENQVPSNSEGFGSIPKDAARFGNAPHDAAPFGKMPHASEDFRSVPTAAERKENHTLTVREVARMFESAGVARSERSIVNWCQPNRQGICRLDAYYDPNERKYYITPQSVETAIAEEKARAASKTQMPPETPESFRTFPNEPEAKRKHHHIAAETDDDRTRELERENLDLKIANRGKDFLIDQMQKERNGFFDQLLTANRKVGELENKLLQLDKPDRG